MDHKKWILALGFAPKENAVNTYSKQYPLHDGYRIDIDFDKQEIRYNEIVAESKTTQNFSQPENFVVLECVDRLLTKGYKPQNIVLEKVWPSGHGTSGRLDICVNRDDGTPYLLIECKTYGKEFDKELAKTHKDGGQLFTYFQLSGGKADVIMLYASELRGKKIDYQNEIIKIEDEYRSGDAKDIYEKWSKLTKNNGIFDEWATPYNFESRALTIDDLIEIKPEDSSFIFNRFLEILRHNVVSDKPNAFNKIFTLFLCKIYDEKEREGTTEELHFQWFEGIDDNVSFQLRLSDLYKNGMYEFLEKRVTDFSEEEFDTKYKSLDDSVKASLLQEFKKIRLEKNNEFAIKEVYDEKSFKENAKVVKQVVELLQGYKIRYATKQQYLSDFFELLLTTGLKQESGQFFTPVPIAQFIIKSLPVEEFVASKLKEGRANELLPYVIDYAAGSGHFLTESMNEIQRLLDNADTKGLKSEPKKFVEKSKFARYDWAIDYVYGIEKDYRLVKVGKVGCYLHGDGLANVIHSDGLARFGHTDYKNRLRISNADFAKENKQFDIVVSNPPYSVAAFKNAAREYYENKDFELYDFLTDNSSEIECLFIERTKQLLKDGGVAGVILPSSILSNAGIYTKAREIILQYFDVIAITELGSNTFMATGTNTVVLFLRRRNNYDSKNIRDAVNRYFQTLNDVTVNGVESPVSKYVAHVWAGLEYADYLTLLQKSPNDKVKAHEIYTDYRKKIRAKDETEFWREVIAWESEKLYYFVIVYPQRVVLVKSGEKDAEKRFLGYEFSNRRGNEGIHPVRGSRNIEECTQLFDAHSYDNPDKASTYIQRAFKGDFESEIAETIQGNVSRVRLVDMLTFDRTDFEKTISTAAKKKVKIESKWDVAKLSQLVNITRGASPRPIAQYITNDKNGINWIKIGDVETGSKYITTVKEKITKEGADKSRFVNVGDFILSNSMSFGRPYIMKTDGCIHDGWLLMSNFDVRLDKDYFYYILSSNLIQEQFIIAADGGTSVDNLNIDRASHVQIPLPPIGVQQQIVAEIEALEKREAKAKAEIQGCKAKIESLFVGAYSKADRTFRISNDDVFDIGIGKRVVGADLSVNGTIPVYSANVFEPFGFIDRLLITDFSIPSVLWGIDGDWMVNCIPANKPFYPTDHCGVLRIKTGDILPRYLAWVLNKEGSAYGFSRTLRASIDRIKGISVKVPPAVVQQKIVSEIEALEKEIAKAQEVIDNTPAQKAAVLEKYL